MTRLVFSAAALNCGRVFLGRGLANRMIETQAEDRRGGKVSQLRQEIELPRRAVPASQPRLAAPTDATHMRQCTMIRLLFGAGRTSTASYLHHQRSSFVCVGLLWAVGLKRLVRAMFFLVCHPQTRRLPLPLPTRYDNETDRRDGSLFCFVLGWDGGYRIRICLAANSGIASDGGWGGFGPMGFVLACCPLAAQVGPPRAPRSGGIGALTWALIGVHALHARRPPGPTMSD